MKEEKPKVRCPFCKPEIELEQIVHQMEIKHPEQLGEFIE